MEYETVALGTTLDTEFDIASGILDCKDVVLDIGLGCVDILLDCGIVFVLSEFVSLNKINQTIGI